MKKMIPKSMQLGKDLLVLLCWNLSEVLQKVIKTFQKEKLTKIYLEVELRYRVAVTYSAM